MNKEQIISVLRNIYDPEIPVNIYDLGLIYDIDIDKDNNVSVLMTVTAPNCPVADILPEEVRQAILSLEGAGAVNVQITFDPPWSPDKLSEEARLELGLL